MTGSSFLRPIGFIFVALFFSDHTIAQTRSDAYFQSIQNRLQNTNDDSLKADLLIELATSFLPVSRSIQLDQNVGLYQGFVDQQSLKLASDFFEQSLRISRAVKYQKGIGRALLVKGRILIQQRNNIEARKCILSALDLFKSGKDLPAVADAFYLMGGTYHNISADTALAMEYLNKALAIYRQTNDLEREIWVLREMADMQLQQGKTKQALASLLQILKSQESRFIATPQYTFNQLATVYARMSNFHEALLYSHKAIDTAISLGDTSMLARFYQQAGMIHYQLQDYFPAKQYFEKALEKYRSANNYFAIVHNANMVREILEAIDHKKEALQFVQRNVGEIPKSEKDAKNYATLALGMAYAATGAYSIAETYADLLPDPSSIAYFTPIMRAGAHYDIGKLYLTARNYRKAAIHMNCALAILHPEGQEPKLLLSNIHYQLYLIDSATGDAAHAFSHYKTYTTLKNSIFNEAKSNQIASLEILYETEKKQRDIELLRRKGQLQQEIIYNTRTSRNIIIGGSIMLLLLLAVLYSRYRLNKMNNRMLQERQKEIDRKNIDLSVLITQKDNLLREKEWLMREIHHRVKNNLQVIMSLLRAKMEFLNNPELLPIFRESLDQVFAMSLIHEKLLHSDQLSSVNALHFVGELVSHLEESFPNTGKVTFHMQIEPVQIDLSQAILVGLILNETITNSLKYAFPGDRVGIIHINLKRLEETNCLLEIEDNGIGMASPFNADESNSFGIQIIRGLSRQLGGRLEFNGTQGVKYFLFFSARKANGLMQADNTSKNSVSTIDSNIV